MTLNHPVGDKTGAVDVRVDWTWKDPQRQATGSDQGQYFVDAPAVSSDGPFDAPDDEAETTPWWKWLVLPITGAAELALLVLYAPFGLAKLFGFDSPLERWLKAALRGIRDNVLPPPFSHWGW